MMKLFVKFIESEKDCMNIPLITSIFAILFTQIIKYPIAYFFNKKRAKLSVITSTGGMPSSHSAAVSSLITALLLEYGFESPLVAIATIFGVIIMFDSMGVRRQSGEQGIVLDIIARHHLAELKTIDLQDRANDKDENPLIQQYNISNYDKMVINRYLGHKPSEVIVGVITGSFIAIIFHSLLANF